MLSADGGRVAFATWIDGRNVLMVNGEPGPPFDWIGWPPAMSDDGSVIAYAARRGAEQFCVVGTETGAAYRRVNPPAMTPDGRHVAFAAEDAEGAFVVADGRRGPAFAWVGDPVLGPGGRVAYMARDAAHRAFVVTDDRPGPHFDRVTKPAIGPDGTVSYAGRRDGRWFVVVDGRESAAAGDVESVFHGGYVVEESGRYRVAGGGSAYEWIGWPARVESGLVYFAARGGEKFLVAGGREIPLGECVVWDPEIRAGEVRFSARVGRGLWRRVVNW